MSENSDIPQTSLEADQVSERAKNIGDEFKEAEGALYKARLQSMEHLKVLYLCHLKEEHPYFIPEQIEYDPLETNKVFKGVKDATCGPSAMRSVLASNNSDYKPHETAKEVAQAFATLSIDGGVVGAEIPSVLNKLQHPVPYKSYLKPSLDDLQRELNKKDQQGNPIPSILGIEDEIHGGHALVAYETAWREQQDDKGKSHMVEKIHVGDPFYGKAFWIPLADIADPKRCGIRLTSASFPDLEEA